MLRVFGFLALSACVAAQSPLGTISGLATDPSGAPVPSVQVVLQNEATGVKTATVSNPAGNYLLPNLTPGKYTLSAEAKGFRKIELTGLAVEAFKTLRQDLKFSLETATTQVTVTESASSGI
ncbi:MAG: carboxypeptidase regulatory-like domain-containing protein, partial [Bryobacteraceae bacterium]|nr:carboxypeptidase regulatory-like domain-containing protein [Bryobacteraceae bacterium]